MSIQEPDSAAYNAGTPAPAEAWFERGSRRFKLDSPPPTGTRLVVQLVPLFAMVVSAEDQSRRYRDAIREPRRIALVETDQP